MPKVAVVMGSKSDLEVVKPAIDTLCGFGIECEVAVLSAHRTPDEAADFAKTAASRGVDALICAAGKAAALPGVMAAFTTLPVIGIPIKSSTLDGLDALLSIVQMPNGIPVATVAINGSENAALLAAQILALKYPFITEKLEAHRASMRETVGKANAALQQEL